MKQWFFLVGSGILLASCSSRPPTEAECQVVSDKEIQYAVAHFPPEDAESLRERLLENAADGMARCTAGKTYKRSDYECLQKADTTESIGKCIAAVSKRLGH